VDVSRQKQGHRWHGIANTQRLKVGHFFTTGLIGRQQSILPGRKLKRLVMDFVPDQFVQTFGISWSWRKQIHDQNVNTAANEIHGLFNKVNHRAALVLVARRNKFNDRDDLSEVMTDRNPIGSSGIDLFCAAVNDSSGWCLICDDTAFDVSR